MPEIRHTGTLQQNIRTYGMIYMEYLKLPIIKDQKPHTIPLSGDDYLKFIMFYLKYICPTARGEKIARSIPVDVPFRL